MAMGRRPEVSIKQLAEKILEMIPESKSKIVYKKLPMDDPKQRKPDISLAKKELHWEPKIKLEDGLVDTIAYFRKKCF